MGRVVGEGQGDGGGRRSGLAQAGGDDESGGGVSFVQGEDIHGQPGRDRLGSHGGGAGQQNQAEQQPRQRGT